MGGLKNKQGFKMKDQLQQSPDTRSAEKKGRGITDKIAEGIMFEFRPKSKSFSSLIC